MLCQWDCCRFSRHLNPADLPSRLSRLGCQNVAFLEGRNPLFRESRLGNLSKVTRYATTTVACQLIPDFDDCFGRANLWRLLPKYRGNDHVAINASEREAFPSGAYGHGDQTGPTLPKSRLPMSAYRLACGHSIT